MNESRVRWPELLIVIGSSLFVFILGLSAYFEADIRWLHFFQAWMYVATVWLVLSRNRWGYFVGISAAGLWDYTNLFVNTFLRSGLRWLAHWASTGQLTRIDQIVAVPAWFGNALVVIGCVWGYSRLSDRSVGDWLRFPLAFTITTGFFVADVALFQPRYLTLFRDLLQPHRPW